MKSALWCSRWLAMKRRAMRCSWAVRLLACALALALSHAPAAWAETTDKVVRIGFYTKITRDLSRAEVQAALTLWADEMFKSYQLSSEKVRFYENMAALRSAFDRGEINFVIATGMDFVRYFKIEELDEGFVSTGQSEQNLLLVSTIASGIRDLKQIKGKRIATLSGDELSEIYLNTVCMQQFRLTCKEVFSSMANLDNSNKLAMSAFFGRADVIAINRKGLEVAGELNPQVAKALQVVHEFPVKGGYFGFSFGTVDGDFRGRALKHATSMHQTPRGQQVLEMFKLDRLYLAQPRDLLPFLHLNQEFEALRAELARRKAAR